MLRKFALVAALGMLAFPLTGCKPEETDQPTTVTPAETPDIDPSEGANSEMTDEADDAGSDEAADDSNATTGN